MPGPAPFSRRDLLTAALAGAAAFAVYAACLPLTVTGEDSGEFITAAWVLGIPHPPGYPLWCMLAHAFTWLPFGEAAWRVALMSAVFGGATVGLLTLLVLLHTRNRAAALAAALFFALTPEFWEQATIAEVYTLNAFLFAFSLLLLFLWEKSRNGRTLAFFSVVFGLGMSTHNTFILLAPCFAGFVLWADCRAADAWPGARRWGGYALYALLSAGVCLAVFMYLPLRSAMNPPLDWGNPENWANFWRHVRRDHFEFMFSQYPRGIHRMFLQACALWRLYVDQGFMGLDLLGLLLLWRLRRGHALFLAACAVVVVSGFAFWQNFELTRDWIHVMSVFPIPAYLIAALCAGLALDLPALLRRTGPYFGRILSILLAAGFVLMGVVNADWTAHNRRDYRWARAYGENVLRTLPQRAVYVSESDHGGFSVLYLQQVHGMRPDVNDARTCGYPHLDEFEALPAELRERIGEFPARRFDPELFSWLVLNVDRPVFFEKPPRFSPEAGIRLVPAGLLWRALPPGAPEPPPRNWWAEYQWPDWDSHKGEFTADAIRCEVLFARARDLFWEARRTTGPETAKALRRQALELIRDGLNYYGPEDAAALNNAGALCARFGEFSAARDYFTRALAALPHLAEARDNLERLEKRVAEDGGKE